MRTLSTLAGAISHVAFAPTGKHLVLVGSGGFFLADWPLAATVRSPFHVEETPEALVQAAWHPDGTTFAVGGVDGVVQVWDTRPKMRRELVRLPGQDGMMTAAAFSPDGAYLAFGDGWDDEPGRVLIVRVGSWTVMDQIELHEKMVGALVFTAARVLVSGGADRKVNAYSIDDAVQEPRVIAVAARVQGLAVGDGRLAVAAGGRIHVYPTDADGFPVEAAGLVCRGHAPSVRGIAFGPDGRFLASAGEDGTIRLWDSTSGALRTTLDPGFGGLRTVAVAPDGLTLVAAGETGDVVVVDVE